MNIPYRSPWAAAAGLISVALLLIAPAIHAGSATWKSNPTSGDWNTAANWTPATVPNGPSDIATFQSSNKTNVSSSGDIQVSGIVFDTVASAFTITASPGFTLEIDSAGVSNNSGSVQNFVAASQFGILVLGGNVTAGPGAVFIVEGGAFNGGSGGEADLGATASMGTGDFIVKGGKVDGAVGGQMDFFGSATAGNGTLTVEGGVTADALGGRVLFLDTSHAGNATLIAQGDSPSNGGTLDFLTKSHGDKARVEVFGSGVFRVDHLKRIVTDFSVGSIEGDGSIILASFGSGAGKNLIVGGNKINTTFSGVIDDGGAGGSLTVKMQRRRLVLTGANTYTGGTTIKSGTLSVSNQSGSGTGTGPVQGNGGSNGGVRGGSLRGNGTIFGPVTVGDGNAVADFTPQSPQTNTGTLTIKNTLTFNPFSEYQWVVTSANGIASRVVAAGVTINSNASFFAFDTTFAKLPKGTVLTAIKNTSANPIVGSFSNLADGSAVTVQSNSFKVNYEGGDGNDLTLTVQ